MKRTEIERRERELKRALKKQAVLDAGGVEKSVNDYIDALFEQFIYNEERIFNTKEDIEVLEVLEEIQDAYPDKAEVIVKKAIRRTKVGGQAKKDAFAELTALLA